MSLASSPLRPLAGSVLSLPAVHAAPGWAAVVQRLGAQASALGMTLQAHPQAATTQTLNFALHTPWADPLPGQIHAGHGHPAASELLQQAACGLMAVHGRARGGIRPLGVAYLSALASVQALTGSLACLVGRLRGGAIRQGELDWATVSLLALGQYLAGATAPEDAEVLLPGHSPEEVHPPFVSADGVEFELEALDAEPWRRFWRAVGVSDSLAGQGWPAFQLRYARAIAPQPAALRDALASRSYADIQALAAQAAIALCPVRTLAERAADPGAQALIVAGPWQFAPGEIASSPAPASTGLLPLAGLTVIESCRRIQGPLAGHLLALLGARVIRIEPPGGDSLRGMPPMADGCSARFDALNHLKTVVELDLKSPAGRRDALALAQDADVFLHNWAPGKAAEFGLDASDLLHVRPGLVYAYAGGWSNDEDGDGLPGTDFMAQAYTGVADQIARDGHGRPGTLFTALDVLGGALATQAVTIGLVGRLTQSRGMAVYSSLAGAAHVLTAHPEAPDDLPSAGGVFATAQGWLALDCTLPDTLARLCNMLDLPVNTAPDAVFAALRPRLLSQPASFWLAELARAGIPAIPATDCLSAVTETAHTRHALNLTRYARVNSPWSFR